jgi:hypothetical protein
MKRLVVTATVFVVAMSAVPAGAQAPDPGFPDSGPSFDIAPFIVLALLWAVVPFVIAVLVAQSRDEPIGSAVLLVLVLGWIGLFIVLRGQRATVRDIKGFVDDVPAERSARSEDPAEARLRVVDDLYAKGLISEQEHAERRAAILKTL